MEGGSSAAAAAEDAGDRNDRGSGEDRGKDKGNNTWSPMLGLRDADVKPVSLICSSLLLCKGLRWLTFSSSSFRRHVSGISRFAIGVCQAIAKSLLYPQ